MKHRVKRLWQKVDRILFKWVNNEITLTPKRVDELYNLRDKLGRAYYG
jgi:hypothetical protein